MTRWGEYRLEWLIVAAGLLAFVIFASFFLADKKAAKESGEVTSTDNISEKEQEEYVVEKRHLQEGHVRLKMEEPYEAGKVEDQHVKITVEQADNKTEIIRQEDTTKKIAEENIVVDRYEKIVYLGGLTLHHIFEEKANGMTVHKAFLDVYPNISVSETLYAKMQQIKKEASKYAKGTTTNIEAEVLSLLNKELNRLFQNGQMRRLPTPDGRIVVGIKVVAGGDGHEHLYFGFNNGQWFPISDEFLVKLIHSAPL